MPRLEFSFGQFGGAQGKAGTGYFDQTLEDVVCRREKISER